ncbi:MAG: 4Fe-4S dicluster domain-containing protein [Acidobacteriota bacterium]
MPRYGMVIDLDRCTACQACVVACKVENNVPFTDPEAAAKGRTMLWIELLAEIEGSFPSLRASLKPRPCLMCDDPPCTKVCPVNATYQNPDGIVAQIYPRCIGCRYCTNACPYGVKLFNWRKPEWPQPMAEGLNPDVSVRPKGVVEKCTFCHQRLQAARERAAWERRPMREEDYQPACAEICPPNAISFGDLDDEKSEVHRLSRHERAFRLLAELGTRPKVYFLREVGK